VGAPNLIRPEELQAEFESNVIGLPEGALSFFSFMNSSLEIVPMWVFNGVPGARDATLAAS
jgi:hypothetical protein